MSEVGKTVPTSISENRYNLNIGESLHLQPQVDAHVEPYELVELFYDGHGVPAHQMNHTSPNSSQSQPQMAEDSLQKKKSPSTNYKCEICGRIFKEASHFSKHKRGALCRKSAQRMAKKHKKCVKERDTCDKKSKQATNLYKPYQCTLCGSKFLDKVNVELHLERTHQTSQSLWLQTSKTGGIACSDCDIWFADKPQLRQHQQQQHANNNNNNNLPPALHTPPIEPPNVQPPLTQQPMPPPPPPPQYYFQPLQHIQTFAANQVHQIGPPSHQGIQQLPTQMVLPPQGHHIPAFVVSHPQSHQNQANMPPSSNHQPISNPVNVSAVPYSSLSPAPLPPPPPSCISPPEPPNSVRMPKVSYSNNWTNSRRNVCGDCGLKFVDPINLELHLQRKHPNSSIVETVGLEGGLTLYKTNNNNNNNLSQPRGDNVRMFANPIFNCVLCDFKAQRMNSVVKHLQAAHNTNNANFISVNSTIEPGDRALDSEYPCGRGMPLKEENFKCRCDSCAKEFESQADLVRHTIKDKNILCAICNYNSCSEVKVAFHMYSLHRDRNSSPVKSFGQKDSLPVVPDSPNSSCSHIEDISGNESLTESSACSLSKSWSSEERLLCCLCDFYALTGASLAEHLESHGSIYVKCGKCNEYSERFIDINNHINIAHAGEITRVSITIRGSKSPTVYMFMIMPFTDAVREASEEKNCSKESTAETSERQKSNGVTNPCFFPDSDEVYACSDCMTCLTGSTQLEAHIRSHQTFNSKLNTGRQCQNGNLPPSQSTLSISSLSPVKSNPLQHTKTTIEFRCKECGFWRVTSDPVIRHIQAVHMSGVVVHSMRQKNGQIKYITIRVFTPLSPLVLS